jgi:hypothetical protein
MPRKLRTLLVYLFISSLIISLSLSVNISIVEGTEIETKIEENYMSPDEFFLKLEQGLDIDLEKVYDYGFCSKQIGYLIEKGFTDNYNAHLMVDLENYSAASFIDKALQVCNYFDRPLDIYLYTDNIKQVSIDIGLIPLDSDLDFCKKLTYEDAEKILEKLISNDFNRVSYEDNESKLKYKIDKFPTMVSTYKKVRGLIDNLPERCIKEFERQNYELRIVPNVMSYHPRVVRGKQVSAFIDFGWKQIYIQQGYEEDIYHEFGHLMLDRLSNKYAVCNYLYKVEGSNANHFPYVRYEFGAEELICDCFEFIFLYSDNEEKINEFKEKCPKIYWLITEGILNTEVKSSRWSINMTYLKKVGI